MPGRGIQHVDLAVSDDVETAILAGGCFWGIQELLRHRDGVISTRAGCTGGESEDPAEDQDYLQRHPDVPTCHFPRPGWKLPHRETAG